VPEVGRKITVSVKLLRVKDAMVLGQRNSSDRLAEILTIQDRIADDVCPCLTLGRRSSKSRTSGKIYEQPEAIHFTSGSVFLEQRSHYSHRDSLDKAVGLPASSGEGPEFALAYSPLANCYDRLTGTYQPKVPTLKQKQHSESVEHRRWSWQRHNRSLAIERQFYDYDFPVPRAFRRSIELDLRIRRPTDGI